ncbi:8565_t:CDS:2 [Rhizophagus irregularis]|nr:8565_t:CDS:2 [Rhizophagus irregularis]
MMDANALSWKYHFLHKTNTGGKQPNIIYNLGSNLTKSNIYRGEPVKRWICLADVGKPRPPRYRADILEEIVQVVGKTNSAVNAFTERLFAVVYLKSKQN